MSGTVYERLPEDESDFQRDVEWAWQHPEYWSERLRLDVADLVVSELDRLGLSPTELAQRMGISPALVTSMLRGNHDWTLDTLAKAGVVLGIQWLVASAPIDGVASAPAQVTEKLPTIRNENAR